MANTNHTGTSIGPGTTDASKDACGSIHHPIATIFWRAACLGLLVLVFFQVKATSDEVAELRVDVAEEIKQMQAMTQRLSYNVGLLK